jgi:hypothetical protein
MRNSLFEAIVGTGQAPNKFWLAVDIPVHKIADKDDDWHNTMRARNSKILTDLAKGELGGVKGISDSREILTQWLMIGRNAAIMMDASKLIELNDIEQVIYDDPQHLCKNNMSALYRLFSKDASTVDGRDGIMMNIMQYVVAAMRKVNNALAHQLDYLGATNIMARKWRNDATPIETPQDLSDAILTALRETDKGRITYQLDELYKEGDMEAAVAQALKHAGRIYSDEREWIVHSEQLRIPPKSVLLVGVDLEVMRGYDEWFAFTADPANAGSDKYQYETYRFENYKRLMEIIHSFGLDRFYTLKIIDGEKFNTLRPQIMNRRRAKAERANPQT